MVFLYQEIEMQLWNLAWFIPSSFTEATPPGLQIPHFKTKRLELRSHVYHKLAACLCFFIIHPYMCLILRFLENTIAIEIRKIYQMRPAVFLWATQAIVLTPVSSWDTEITAFFTVIGRLDHTRGLPGKCIMWIWNSSLSKGLSSLENWFDWEGME